MSDEIKGTSGEKEPRSWGAEVGDKTQDGEIIWVKAGKFDAKAEIARITAKVVDDQQHKSFSERNLGLGKMINCPICDSRHRSVRICKQRHVVALAPPPGLTELTKFQAIGRAAFVKKRVNPHHSTKLRQLVQRTIELYPLNVGQWASTETKSADQVAMEVARREARAELQEKRNLERANKTSAQHRSRRINCGLLVGNSKRHR